MKYVIVPSFITIKDVRNNGLSLSPYNYKQIVVKKKYSKKLKDYLSEKPLNGEEVGSDAYIQSSNKFFIRTKSLQDTSYLLSDGKSIIPILPSKFKDQDLRKGDLLISKDSNLGEVVILEKNYPNHMVSNGIYRLRINENKYYVLGFIKQGFFKAQLNLKSAKGATIKHGKKLFLECTIPDPQRITKSLVDELEETVEQVVSNEISIQNKENQIQKAIEEELEKNQSKQQFHFVFPTNLKVGSKGRIDAGFYCEDFEEKQFIIKNYKHGAGNIEEWGYDISRGQNLQVSAIGKSIYSNTYINEFYKLARPTNLSDFGTVQRYEYLGNQNELNIIQPGDIIFSAEGSIGKCVMFAEPGEKLITNIHGIILNKKDHDLVESAFVCCFLRYLRNIGVLDYISVGGQGGSLAMKYWSEVLIPFFPDPVKNGVSKLYFNQDDQNPGILQMDKENKQLNERIQIVIDKIIEESQT